METSVVVSVIEEVVVVISDVAWIFVEGKMNNKKHVQKIMKDLIFK